MFTEKSLNNIVLFGAGAHTTELLKFPELEKIKFKYIVDNNKNKWNTVFCNLKVYPPDKIDDQISHIIISSHSFEKEIFNQLLEMGIKKDKIIKFYS